jgi:hypothetical protein
MMTVSYFMEENLKQWEEILQAPNTVIVHMG